MHIRISIFKRINISYNTKMLSMSNEIKLHIYEILCLYTIHKSYNVDRFRMCQIHLLTRFFDISIGYYLKTWESFLFGFILFLLNIPFSLTMSLFKWSWFCVKLSLFYFISLARLNFRFEIESIKLRIRVTSILVLLISKTFFSHTFSLLFSVSCVQNVLNLNSQVASTASTIKCQNKQTDTHTPDEKH